MTTTQIELHVTVRYFAAACAAAGVEEEVVSVSAPATVAAVLARSVELHGPELAAVLERCSFLLDEYAVHDRSVPVTSGQAIDVLPPFAGG